MTVWSYRTHAYNTRVDTYLIWSVAVLGKYLGPRRHYKVQLGLQVHVMAVPCVAKAKYYQI